MYIMIILNVGLRIIWYVYSFVYLVEFISHFLLQKLVDIKYLCLLISTYLICTLSLHFCIALSNYTFTFCDNKSDKSLNMYKEEKNKSNINVMALLRKPTYPIILKCKLNYSFDLLIYKLIAFFIPFKYHIPF